jgi:hypothetical protein
MLVATVIATMTFQTGINSPNGVWQEKSEAFTNFLPDSHHEDYTCYYYFTIPTLSLHLWASYIWSSMDFFFRASSIYGFWRMAYLSQWCTCHLPISKHRVWWPRMQFSLDFSRRPKYWYIFGSESFWLLMWFTIIRLLAWMVKKLPNFICKSTRGPSRPG